MIKKSLWGKERVNFVAINMKRNLVRAQRDTERGYY